MANRQEEKAALREKRLAEERLIAASDRRRKLLRSVGSGLLGLLALGGIVLLIVTNDSPFGNDPTRPGNSGKFVVGRIPSATPLAKDLPAAAKAAGCVLLEEKSEGDNHVATPVRYKANPPHSGDHDIIPAEEGAYTDPPLLTQNFVHTLEHGRIHLQYRKNAPEAVQGRLKALYDEDPYHMLLTPNLTEMPYEVAATAWRKSLTCPRENPKVYDAMRAFTKAYRDRSPEYVP